jgi:hypothetical protein
MKSGVTLVDPSTAYIETQVEIGQRHGHLAEHLLQGETTIGESCTIGPNAILRDTRMGDGCQVYASVLEGAVVEDNVDIGLLPTYAVELTWRPGCISVILGKSKIPFWVQALKWAISLMLAMPPLARRLILARERLPVIMMGNESIPR